MTILIYFSIGVVVGYLAWVSLGNSKKEVGSGNKHRDQLILNIFEKKEIIVNSDVQRLLGVSDATSTRYLQKLEDEGKIRQEGETGRFVHYIKI